MKGRYNTWQHLFCFLLGGIIFILIIDMIYKVKYKCVETSKEETDSLFLVNHIEEKHYHNCRNCGAPYAFGGGKCLYCGTEI